MSVKYGGQHVKNSPFTVRVSGAPDPEKVKVYGPGVEHGVSHSFYRIIQKMFNAMSKLLKVLAMYQSRFICDTRGAGAGQLTVRIRGPKGKEFIAIHTSSPAYGYVIKSLLLYTAHPFSYIQVGPDPGTKKDAGTAIWPKNSRQVAS